MKLYAAIDPGANGCLCFLSDTGEVEFYDFAKVGLAGYVKALQSVETPFTMVVIEAVSAMRGQGVTSVFSFGQRLGELEGMLITLGIGYEKTRPQKWQKTCSIPAKSGKKGTYEVMSKLYPEAELSGPKGGIMDGRCDALGLAHYLRKTY